MWICTYVDMYLYVSVHGDLDMCAEGYRIFLPGRSFRSGGRVQVCGGTSMRVHYEGQVCLTLLIHWPLLEYSGLR